jgi:hypothetical protein
MLQKRSAEDRRSPNHEALRDHFYASQFPVLFGILQIVGIGLMTWLCLANIEMQKQMSAFVEGRVSDRKEIDRLSDAQQGVDTELRAMRSLIALYDRRSK